MKIREPEGQTARWIELLSSFDFEKLDINLERSIPMQMLLAGFCCEENSLAKVLKQEVTT